MRELINDPFYEVIKNYDRCVIDYCLVEDDAPYQGLKSHRDALEFAILREMPFSWEYDIDAAKAEAVDTQQFLQFPTMPWKDNRFGTTLLHADFEGGGVIPYWYAFLEPPHGTGPVIVNGETIRNEYGAEDFEIVNHNLFPLGTEQLEVLAWTTDWSNYFDAGHEWWGASCWSIYDGLMKRFVVIMASSTD